MLKCPNCKNRLTIAAVAATAASVIRLIWNQAKPPHDCRSRGDCGKISTARHEAADFRLTIAAVAATAAKNRTVEFIPSCRLTIAAVAATAAAG